MKNEMVLERSYADLRKERIRAARRVATSTLTLNSVLKRVAVLVTVVVFIVTSAAMITTDKQSFEKLSAVSTIDWTTYKFNDVTGTQTDRQLSIANNLFGTVYSIENSAIKARIVRVNTGYVTSAIARSESGLKINTYALPYYYKLVVDYVNLEKVKNNEYLANFLKSNTEICFGAGQFTCYLADTSDRLRAIPAKAMTEYFSNKEITSVIAISEVKSLLKSLR